MGSAPKVTPAGFPKAVRLLTARQFGVVFERGLKSRDTYFLIVAAPSDLPHARLGLAVSRKAAPTAVARNRLKRYARESFRCNQAQLAGIDLVVLAQREAKAADSETLRRSLEHHWDRIRQKCKQS